MRSARSMSSVALALALTGAALLVVPTSSQAAAAAKPCTDNSTSCMIATANTYLDALLDHDADSARLHPSARSTKNGDVAAENADEIRDYLRSPTLDEVNTGMRQKRWFRSGENVIVILLLDTSTYPPIDGVHTTTTLITERFLVRKGLIHEIESVFWATPSPVETQSGWPAPEGETYTASPAISPAAAPDKASWCRSSTGRCAIRAARSYLEALPTRDYRKTQLHDLVRRTQNSDTTGLTADDVRRNGRDPHPDAAITGIRDMRWFVTRHGSKKRATFTVMSFSLADTSTVPKSEAHTGTVHLANRFTVVKGLITEIESVYWISPGTEPESSGWE